MNTSTALYGADDYQLTDPVLLNAGPLTLSYVDGICKTIKLGEIEIVKRIYMALRDHIWNTVHPEITPAIFEKSETSFHLNFTAEHKKEDIHFVWDGDICGDETGTITFTMKGLALSTFKRNRIGLCILHPLALCTGRACKVITVDGVVLDQTFPDFISPFQPFKNIREIRYNVASIATVSILCEGDIFEMEDQRNWTDASFKTYSTPLALPIPVVVEKGTVINQTVKVSVSLEKPFRQTVPKPVEITIGPVSNQYTIPSLGVVWAKNEQITPFSAEMLQQLDLSHIRFDINCDSDTLVQQIEDAARICAHLHVSAELALFFSDAFEAELQFLLTALKTAQLTVSSFLLYKTDTAVTPSA
ncbi:MAG: hypothetical protein GX640_18395, partial [Fibrobacter sp.]|nr:hypothetical protein [Fibrobacter sp.]